MTDPVVLLGTQSNGETLPVQVNEYGQLVAEGLQGVPGPPGPPGVGELPPDPYEGALLGWLNGELSWVSGGVTPIPEGLFGPIAAWDPTTGVITVDGTVPETIVAGVFIYQADAEGQLITPGINVSQDWSALTQGQVISTSSKVNAFDNNMNTVAEPQLGTGGLHFTAGGFTSGDGVVVYTAEYNGGGGNAPTPNAYIEINGVRYTASTDGSVNERTGTIGEDGILDVKWDVAVNGGDPGWCYCLVKKMTVGGIPVVDPQFSVALNVSSVAGNQIAGTMLHGPEFTPGYYLKAPEQQVATWLQRKVVLTSVIDDLRHE